MTADLLTFGPAAVGAVLFLLLAAWCFSVRRVDRSLAVLGLYLGLLDGYLKLRTGSAVITLGRDVLVVAIAGGALLRSMNSHKPMALPPLGGLVIAFAAVVFIELFNPSAPGIIQGLAGVRTHLEFVPLFFLGYVFVRRESQVRGLVIILVICAAAGGLVSLVQSLLTPEQFAQWGPGYSERILGTGVFAGAGRQGIDAAGSVSVRPFGLGSDVGAGALVAALGLPGLIALLMSASGKIRLALAPAAVGIALAVIVSGSRGGTVAAIVSVVSFGVVAAVSKNALRAIVGLAIGAVLLFVVAQQLGPSNPAKNRARSVAPDKIVSTFSQERGSSVTLFDDYAAQFPLGRGVGTVGPATAVTGQPNSTGLNSETLWNYLVIETGLAGLATILALFFRLMWLALTRTRRIVDPAMRLYLAAVAAPLFGMVFAGFGGATTIAVPFGPYLWLAAGVLSYWLITFPRSSSRPPTAHDSAVADASGDRHEPERRHRPPRQKLAGAGAAPRFATPCSDPTPT
ncbi:MAG: hypothetical protein WKF96_03870 [Solirubrobacteraceae bacterium]